MKKVETEEGTFMLAPEMKNDNGHYLKVMEARFMSGEHGISEMQRAFPLAQTIGYVRRSEIKARQRKYEFFAASDSWRHFRPEPFETLEQACSWLLQQSLARQA